MDNIKVKYPRTYHMPFSPGRGKDDKVLDNLDHFVGQRVVVTEKMDGENTTLYPNYLHARSLDSRHHPSRDWIKAFHSTFAHHIPDNWRICGENLYARHSIPYDDLESFFYTFSVWEKDFCLDWEFTTFVCKQYHLTVVPVLYEGIFDEMKIRELASNMDLEKHEGFVMRLKTGFLYSDFDKSVAKYVRPQHVQSDEHWMHQQVIPNKLRNNNE